MNRVEKRDRNVAVHTPDHWAFNGGIIGREISVLIQGGVIALHKIRFANGVELEARPSWVHACECQDHALVESP
ncbi:hypothetical protein [Acetobacter oeni]|uniref:Uncharacterized protein n=1 Tax=Acetobacter oeni TaxID=304077 RepID=A0A511XKW3_9PROT|nr:hypothetical protein [Acetobacter oeni]MBB3883818.1 putative nucleic acid-binding Zn ribbon protein [Acetobacter oeni]NHO19841.1 hypothetical protein [Acetobacter oeni]GEN63570.1 hypothetical protein AOE01nite_17940 [Acetobacter oeni]